MFNSDPYFYLFIVVIGIVVCSIALILFIRFLDKKANHPVPEPTKLSLLLKAFAISWCFAVSLGCVLVLGLWASEGNFEDWKPLMICQSIAMIMFVPPIGLMVSTFAAVLATPFAAIALRTGFRNLIFYGSFLWVFLACYLFMAPSFRNDGLAISGGILLAVVGLLYIGQIPPKKSVVTEDVSKSDIQHLKIQERSKKSLFFILVPLSICVAISLVYWLNKLPDDENALIELMGNNDESLSFNAAHKLEQKGKDPFIQACSNSNPKVRACAAHFLKDFTGKEVQGTLMTTANDSDPWV
jgi:hypothetical protein